MLLPPSQVRERHRRLCPFCGRPTIGAYAGNVDRDALKREVDAELLTEKEQEIQDLRETVEVRLGAPLRPRVCALG